MKHSLAQTDADADAAAAKAAGPGTAGPPVARIEPVRDRFFGRTVVDPYRWMENPKDRDWEQFHSPKNLAMAVSVEAAELLEHFLWIDNDESRRQMQDPARLEAVSEEIADVVGACLALCNALGLDLSDIFFRKMSKNVLKYPADRARGRYRLDD